MAEAKRKTDSPLIVDGIKVNITPEDLDDADIMEALVTVGRSENSDDPAMAQAGAAAMQDLYELMFGDDWPRIKEELREKHGVERAGRKRLPASVTAEFVTKVFDAVNRKNS